MKMNRIIIAGGLLVCMAGAVFATALSANKSTPSIAGKRISLTVKNDEVIYAGGMVSVDTNSEAVASTDSASDQVVGRAATYVNNADDGEVISVDVGIFGWAKSGTIGDSSIGDIVYVVDDNTVATSDPGNACIARVLVDQDSNYAYVSTH